MSEHMNSKIAMNAHNDDAEAQYGLSKLYATVWQNEDLDGVLAQEWLIASAGNGYRIAQEELAAQDHTVIQNIEVA